MITLAEAESIAAGWAHRQSLRRGYPCAPQVDELSHGYAVWMQLPADIRTEPGEDVTTIIDRETGRLSHWPPAPPAELDEHYNQRRAAVIAPHRTSDPEAELRREAHRRVSPTVAAHMTLGDRVFRAFGAKSEDADPVHHPLVAHWLRDTPPGELVRGAERHAELLVLSDVFFEADRTRAAAGDPPLTLDEGRTLLSHGEFEPFHVRERGDKLGGQPARPCATCLDVLIRLAVVPGKYQSLLATHRETGGDDPQPGRFPPEVAWELAAGGWNPADPQRRLLGHTMATVVQERRGLEFALDRFPAADAAYTEFFGVSSSRTGAGIGQRVRGFIIGAGELAGLADPLHEFGTLVGARMFPLGVEGVEEAVLVIDEHGRVFALDQGGEWFVADTLDEALVALTTGAPATRVDDDGTW